MVVERCREPTPSRAERTVHACVLPEWLLLLYHSGSLLMCVLNVVPETRDFVSELVYIVYHDVNIFVLRSLEIKFVPVDECMEL